MTELSGLANIIGNADTLHTLSEPPSATDFASLSDYEAAYDAWWTRTNCWTVTRGQQHLNPAPSPTGL